MQRKVLKKYDWLVWMVLEIRKEAKLLELRLYSLKKAFGWCTEFVNSIMVNL